LRGEKAQPSACHPNGTISLTADESTVIAGPQRDQDEELPARRQRARDLVGCGAVTQVC